MGKVSEFLEAYKQTCEDYGHLHVLMSTVSTIFRMYEQEAVTQEEFIETLRNCVVNYEESEDE